MNATLEAALSDAERLMVTQTEQARLVPLSEDEAVELESHIRRARNKYVGQYRRGASARVAEKGGRGMARPANKHAALKAEAFETALARVSGRVAFLARQSAAQLRRERLASARAMKQDNRHARSETAPPQAGARKGPAVPRQPTGDRALRSPATEKARASTRAAGARRQAKRDSR